MRFFRNNKNFIMIKEYWGDNWRQKFSDNDLDNFDAIWDLNTDWFEEPNQRRGGWSGVVRIDLNTPQGQEGIFIKRQENHITKTISHPFRGMPTFQREFKNILRSKKNNLPIFDLVYFAKRKINGNLQAILITKELTDYIPLESERFLVGGDLIKNKQHKEKLIEKVADTLRQFHQYHYQHNCLYLKHIFVKPVEDSWDVKLIDLEKLKRAFFKRDAVFRDLYTLYRHAKGWSKKDQVKFFKVYVEEKKLSLDSKKLWRSIEARMLTKSR